MPNIERLAIQVEDHGLDYINFQGEIPEGLYGAGKVEIWDRESYKLRHRTPKMIEFTLNGKKLKGDIGGYSSERGDKYGEKSLTGP